MTNRYSVRVGRTTHATEPIRGGNLHRRVVMSLKMLKGMVDTPTMVSYSIHSNAGQH